MISRSHGKTNLLFLNFEYEIGINLVLYFNMDNLEKLALIARLCEDADKLIKVRLFLPAYAFQE